MIARHVRLPRLDAEPLGHGRAEWQLVEEAQVHAGNRYRAALLAAHDRFAEGVRPVGGEIGRDFHLVEHGIDAAPPVRLRAHRVDAAIRPASRREREEPLVDVAILEVDRLRAAARLGHAEALGHPIHRDHASRPQHPRALDAELAHGTTSPDGYGVARFDVRVLRGLVARGKDVGEEENLLVTQLVRDLERTHVRERHAEVFRLASREATQHVRVAEQSRRGVTEGLARHLGVRVRHVAEGEAPLAARQTVTAGHREGHHHAIAGAKLRHVAPDLDDLAHRLMADDVALFHVRHEAAEEVEIGPADRGGGDAHDGVARITNARVRHRVEPDVLNAVPAEGSHGNLLYEPAAKAAPASPSAARTFASRAVAKLPSRKTLHGHQGKERKVASIEARESEPGRAKGTTTGTAPVLAKTPICSRQAAREPTAPSPSSTRSLIPFTAPARSPAFHARFTASTSSAKPHSAKKRAYTLTMA